MYSTGSIENSAVGFFAVVAFHFDYLYKFVAAEFVERYPAG